MAGVIATKQNLNPEYEGTRKVERYHLTNGSPTVAAQAGAGTASGGAATITGPAGVATDFQGQVTVTIGTTPPAGGGTLFTVTFANVLAGTPNPIISPANNNGAAAVAGTASPWVVAGSTGFSVVAGSLSALTAYIFDYICPGAWVPLTITSPFISKIEDAIGASIIAATFSANVASLRLRPSFTTGDLKLSGSN